MRCPNCNVEVPDNTKFCMNCGKPLPQDQTQDIRAQETQSIQGNDPFEPTQRMEQPQNAQDPAQRVNQQYQQAQTQQIPQGQQPQYQQGQTQQMPPQGQYQQAPVQGAQQPSIAPFVLSIIALVLSLLGLFPVSLILAIIALVMNSKQKKRGELSTKQTPTFVMSIISLVISVIMAICTIVLGGAIWLAVMNGDFNTKSYSSSYTTSKNASSSSSKSSASSKSSSASTSKSTSSSSSASSKASKSYSTDAPSTISDFSWVSVGSKPTPPADATTLTQFGDIAGEWKAYMYGGGTERLFNVSIGGTSGSILMDFDWDKIYDRNTGKTSDDNSGESLFKGALAGSALEATGSGKVTLTNFWEANGHQYATGTFMWPSGEVENVALVRP